MTDKKEVNLEDTEKISGGAPNPNSNKFEEWNGYPKEIPVPDFKPVKKDSDSDGNSLTW